MANNTTNNSQAPSHSRQSDMLNVMIKESLSKIDQYQDQIVNINASLVNARTSLQNTPGIQTVIQAINQNIQINNNRAENLQNVRHAEDVFFQTIENAYQQFARAVNSLQNPEQPAPNNQQLQIGDQSQSTMQTGQTINTNNVNNNQSGQA